MFSPKKAGVSRTGELGAPSNTEEKSNLLNYKKIFCCAPDGVEKQNPEISSPVELGAPLNPKEKRKSRNPKKNLVRLRTPQQFAVFGLSFKVSEEYRRRKLYCIITIDDHVVSDDIYHGPLHEGDSSEFDSSSLDYHDLVLTGPQKCIEATGPVYLNVAIYDMEDPQSEIPLRNANSSRGTFPDQSVSPQMFVWVWDRLFLGNFKFNKVFSDDLIEGDEFFPSEYYTFGLCGSIELTYAVFWDAVVAKVEVKVKASHHICGGEVTAKFYHEEEEEEIVLFRRKASYCQCGVTKTSEEKSLEQLLLPLELSRSLVTMPSTASALTVGVILHDCVNNEIVNGSAKLSVPAYSLVGGLRTSEEVISTSEEVISCQTQSGSGILVTVTWI